LKNINNPEKRGLRPCGPKAYKINVGPKEQVKSRNNRRYGGEPIKTANDNKHDRELGLNNLQRGMQLQGRGWGHSEGWARRVWGERG